MDFAELGSVVDALSKERGIERSVVIGAIEKAFLVAARKKFGIQGEYETKYSEATDEIETFQYKNVVDSVRDEILEINLEASHELDPEAEIGDQIGIKLDKPNFTRVDIQTIRQIIFQKVRDAEREILFSEFKHREGELITGIARRYERGNVIVDLGKADAVLPRRETIYGENFKVGDRIQAYLTEVVMVNRGPEIRLSRTTPLFLVKLFEIEVPEIADGTIEIKSAAREPGQRAKIAVYTRDRDIDPVGACVGLKGSRVQNIVAELQGEKIDIVRWSDDIETFARAALAPSEIENIMIDYDDKSMDVVVEDDQLSLAIGRRGQNVRLAAMLSGYRINIISKTKLQERINRAADNLVQIAHNVQVGENSLLVAQVGIAGSTIVGKNVIMAGQAGITGHLVIGDGAIIGPQTGVSRNISPGEVVSGSPQMPHRKFLKTASIFSRLPEMRQKLRELEKQMVALREQLEGVTGDEDV